MQFQVADRIEKKLQELPYFDKVKTYSKPGFVAACRSSSATPRRPARCRGCSTWCARRWRTCRADLPDGVIGPIVNDEYGDVDSVLYTLRSATAPTTRR